MESKINELTEKLLREGVDKGKAEAERIIAEAKQQAEAIIAEAKQQAAGIEEDARKSSKALETNTKNEIKMYTQQALEALKSEVANVLTNKISATASAAIADDKKFMNTFVLKLAEKWGAGEDLIISTEDAEGLKAVFAKEAKTLLDGSIKIEQVNGQKASFVIRPADGAYKVEFGAAEFESYFKNFLRPQLIEMIF